MLTTGSSVYGMTTSEFASKYNNQFEEGEKIQVLVHVKGDASSDDPAKKAKEIRYYQAGVLKFIHFAGAVNVVSNTEDNSFTAIMTMSLAEKISTRYDVKSVVVIDDNGNKVRNLCLPYGPGANLAGCDLYGVDFHNMNLGGANFSGANLKGANFEGADVSNADLRGAFLKYSILNGVNLTNANLAFSKLIRADVTNADLTGANFYRAYLYDSDFTDSDLTNVDFRYSMLTYAILVNTNLEGANLENAGTWNTNLNHCYNHEICR